MGVQDLRDKMEHLDLMVLRVHQAGRVSPVTLALRVRQAGRVSLVTQEPQG